jgi:hypothetical protein
MCKMSGVRALRVWRNVVYELRVESDGAHGIGAGQGDTQLGPRAVRNVRLAGAHS